MSRVLFAFALLVSFSAAAQETIKIGLITALSGQSARAGEAITRGLQVAIDELNAAGGVLGRKFELLRRDDEATPAKGVIAARELVHKEKVAVLFGGLDTPVSMAIVPIMNEAKVPSMGPWPPARRSPRTAPIRISCSAFPRWMKSSTRRSCSTRRRTSTRRSRA